MLFVALTASHSRSLSVKTRAGAAAEETKQPPDETWTLLWVKSWWPLTTDPRRNIYRDRPANHTSCCVSLDWIHGRSPLGVLEKVRISKMKRSLLKYKHWTDYFCFSGVEQRISAPLTSPPPHSNSTTPPSWGKQGGTEIAKRSTDTSTAEGGSSRFHGDV